MKKIIYLFIYLSINFLSADRAFGQYDSIKGNFLVLYSGDIIITNKLQYLTPIFYTDNTHYNQDDVEYYHDPTGLYKNTLNLNKPGSSSFVNVRREVGGPNSGNIVLYSGQVIKCNSIQHQSHFLITESTKYHEDDVEFYRKDNDLFANTRKFSILKKTSAFIKAETTGKINLFRETTVTYSRDSKGNQRTNIQTSLYYNKGYGDLKFTKLKYLKKDLADNAASLQLLEKVKKRKIISGCLWTVTVLIIPLAVYQYNTDDESGGTILAEVAGMVVLALTAKLVNRHEDDNIEKAINIYNAGY